MLGRPSNAPRDKCMKGKIRIQEMKHRAQERILTVNDLAKEVAMQLQNRAEETALEIAKKAEHDPHINEVTASKILADQVKEEAEKIKHMAREESLIEKNLAHEQAASCKLNTSNPEVAETTAKMIVEKTEEHAEELTHKVEI